LSWMCLWCIVVDVPVVHCCAPLTWHLPHDSAPRFPIAFLSSSVAIISCLLFLRTRGGLGDAIDRTAHCASSRSIARAPSPPSLATLAGLTVLHHVLPAHPFN
jgi:hypothetical protein